MAKEKVQMTDEQLDREAADFGKAVSKMPKAKVMIPKDPLNPKDDSVVVHINGFNWQIKRGVEAEVPLPVAEVLEHSDYTAMITR